VECQDIKYYVYLMHVFVQRLSFNSIDSMLDTYHAINKIIGKVSPRAAPGDPPVSA